MKGIGKCQIRFPKILFNSIRDEGNWKMSKQGPNFYLILSEMKGIG